MEEKKTDKEIKEPFKDKIKNYIKNLLDFSQYDKKTILYIIVFGVIVIFSVYLFIYNYFIDTTFLYTIVLHFVNGVQMLGFWGIFLFIGIMAIQGLIIPIPSEIVLLSTGMIWGIWGGGFMGIVGSMAAGILCFYISRLGGRPLVEKFIGEKAMLMADDFIEKNGIWAILISRTIPFIAFDPISYVSGLVEMDVKKYSVGTLIGAIPRAFFYAFLGASFGIDPNNPNIEAQSNTFNLIFLIICAVLGGMFIAYYLYGRYYAKKNLNK